MMATLEDLRVGSRIYYTGDMANESDWGTVKEKFPSVGHRGGTVSVQFEKKSIQSFVHCAQIGTVYKGTCNPRFVTEEAYSKFFKKPRFHNVKIFPDGTFGGQDGSRGDVKFSARFDLFIIKEAWHAGVSFEDLADGFGVGEGTKGDWSGIRDSSHKATERMFERALEHFFGEQ